ARSFGLDRGSRIAIMARSQLGWVLSDVAVTIGGWVSVPIYPTVVPSEARFVLDDSGSELLIVENAQAWVRIRDGEGAALSLRGVVCLDPDGRGWEGAGEIPVRSLAAIESLGQAALADAPGATPLEGHGSSVGLDDLFSIVYTSGTTGRAKGVEITHKNIIY